MPKASDRKPTAPVQKAEREPQELHRIPVIDKMMQIIEEIRIAGAALSITTITEKTRIPRSTVYRVLNTLSSHGIITRNANGDYSLGFGLVALAASVDTDVSREELIRLSHPVLSQLANDLGETCKLSVLDGMAVEVIDVVQSTNPMAPSSRIGSQFPLHAGAASKLLLAYAPDKLVQTVVKEKLERFTDNTIVDKAALLEELAAIRAAGISHDTGEWNANVHALSAPVFRAGGTAIAALSVTYFASQSDAEEETRLQTALTRAAATVSKLLGHSA